MSKYVYIYDKLTKEYRVVRDGISSASFKHLRDCKFSWKLMKHLVNSKIEVVKNG